MSNAALIFPHQLFPSHPALKGADRAFLIEDPLFFAQYPFHAQKLLLHRLSMGEYAKQLRENGCRVDLIEQSELSQTGYVARILSEKGVRTARYVDPTDDWLASRLKSGLERYGIQQIVVPDPHFLTNLSEIRAYSSSTLRFANFYKDQRRRLSILVDSDGNPENGKWSFDTENRRGMKSCPAAPPVQRPPCPARLQNELEYVRSHAPKAVGLSGAAEFGYPINRAQALEWLEEFLDWRFPLFGKYEDAIGKEQSVLFHSVLTPMLNIGLLSPGEVVEAALSRRNDVPFNSLEGFIRQIIGWREFMRLVYLLRGRRQRSKNFWGFSNPMPKAFYDATTGIEPVDTVIRKVLRTGYCHHIERLMVLGNFMMLCEIDPNAVYQWFMEFFIDAYDWVMVPNVYGMSQFADGGGCTTKPYLSGSNYILKMSDFSRGPWCEIWDSLYWRFIEKHLDFFSSQPRLGLAAQRVKGMSSRMDGYRKIADAFLATLHGNEC